MRPPLARVAMVLACTAVTAAASPPQADAVLSCNVNTGVPPLVRSEGLSEPIGDIVLSCPHDAGTPTTSNGANVPTANITLFLNTNVTSRVLATSLGGAPPYFTDTLLILDEAGSGGVPLAPCQTASGVCQNKGNGTGSGYYVGQPGSNGNVNIFQGTLNPSSPNALMFNGVPLDPPASGQTRVLRIANVRANANSFPPPGGVTPAQVAAFVSLSSTMSVAISNPQQTVGFVQRGHTTTLRNPEDNAALDVPTELRTCDQTANARVGTLRFSEGYANAFRKRNPGSTLTPSFTQDTSVPGTPGNTETMFFGSTLIGSAARGDLRLSGLPDAGTRLAARFEDVPPGVRLFVDLDATPVGTQAQSASLTPGETGGFFQMPASGGGPSGAAEVPLAGGRGTAVWEMTAADATNPGSLDFGVYAAYAAGVPPAGTLDVTLGLAPAADPAADNRASPGPIPRFDRNQATRGQLLKLVACAPQEQPGGATPGGGTGKAATLDSLNISRIRFPAARRGGSIARGSAAGARVRYTLSAPATVRFFVDRRRVGRPRFKRLRGRFEHSGTPGANSFRFTGRVRRRALPPGRFRLVAAPVLPGGTLGTAKRASFRIIR